MSARSRIAAVYLLGFSIDLANMFAINAAYPALQRALHASVAQLAWVGNVYMLGLTVVIPLGAWLAHRFGERRLLTASLLVFALGSAGAASAPSIGALLASRLVQGLGGGLLIPVGQAMTYRAYPREARARLTSIVMMVALLVPAASPALGGVIVDHASWRVVFWSMLALAASTCTLALAWLPADVARDAPRTLDAAGLGLAYVRHARRSSAPLLDLALLSQPLLRVGVVIYLCVPGIFTGVNLIASLFLQNALGLGATQVGALMVPWAAASFAAIATTRRAFPAVGARPLLACGVVVDCIGIALLATPLAAHEAGRVLAYVAMGFGASLCTSTSQTAAFLDVPADRMGEASALWNINRQLSFCLGVAVLGGMLNFLLAAGGGDAPLAYRRCFAFGALLTLLPLPLVARLGSRRAAVSPAVSVDAQSNRT
ncbi:EmrB/QacA family drug resistance transporter [Burkholderia pseudomallei]|uniref:MFS transporter n=1 Tax=Burkholderia pseudomallei TaxID=28450 RepID=UPI000F08651C|nr:MFS transporter [Burkholderia pseudomallei]VBS85796.1 EmrB/QacA family drug resistance transporter [Burkholderia pseudomallei]